MKTLLLKGYTNRLANLNDQLCFFLFNREELNSKLINFTNKANDLYTTDLFASNSYAPKIHVTFAKLPQFIGQNQTLNFGAYFSFSYEFLSSYIEDVLTIISEINGVTLTANEQKKDLERQLNKLIEKCGLGTPPAEIIDTISYFRLRRNYFTHILESMNNKFIDLVNNKGNALNTYWNTSITELDFTNNNVDQFNETETFELLKIIRITLESLDAFIGGILSKTGISNFVTKSIYDGNPTRINNDVIRQRKNRVSREAYQKFGVRLTDIEMDNAVRTIGCR
jgi:hypothetical protein